VNELVDASRSEFDYRDRIWVIPAERMKGRNAGNKQARAHILPRSKVNTMAEAVTKDRPAVISRPGSTKPAVVSASALALHLDCSRTYIGKLESEGVLQRQGSG
jgi:hypothetical protein